jgi:hypothetical protein
MRGLAAFLLQMGQELGDLAAWFGGHRWPVHHGSTKDAENKKK